jgi:hypothetical protein
MSDGSFHSPRAAKLRQFEIANFGVFIQKYMRSYDPAVEGENSVMPVKPVSIPPWMPPQRRHDEKEEAFGKVQIHILQTCVTS